MAKLRVWKMTLAGKTYMLEARTIKGATNKAVRVARALIKLTEVKK